MARLIYAGRAIEDLERLVEFLIESDPRAAAHTVELVVGALQILGNHPLIGRRASDVLRELVISRGRSGYVALYRFDAEADVVRILTIRHQREAGYPGDAEA
ncbi:MAG: type II toxin-antitoxin system RelE/ParE family toxin [Rudaea sp.]